MLAYRHEVTIQLGMIKKAYTRYGAMNFLDNDVYIGRSLEKYGEYSADEVEFLLDLVDENACAVDVGANIGCMTLPLSLKCETVFAFEPQMSLFEILDGNVPFEVIKHRCALGAKRGSLSLPDIDYTAELNFGGVALEPSNGKNHVAVCTLDDFVMERCDLIKIDAEGAELDILVGAVNTIDRHRPVIYCEHDGAEQLRRLVILLHEFQYDVFIHTPYLYRRNNFREDPEDIFNGIVSQNLVAIPREKPRKLRTDLGPLAPVPHAEVVQETPRDELYLPSKEKPKTNTKKKIGWCAVARLGGIGDNLIASSVLPLMKEKYGKLEVITEAPYDVVFENNPYIDKLSVYAKGALPQGDAWQEWFTLRSKEYDMLVNLSHSVESTIGLFKSHSSFYWPAEFRRKLCDVSYLERAHDICGVEHKFAPKFYPTEEETTAAIAKRQLMGDRPVIGWCITGSRLDKVYPYSALVIPRLIKELGAFVMMFGAPGKDFQLAKAIETQVNLTNSTGDGLGLALSPDEANPSWPIRRILSQAQQCDLVIGPDTGPMWSVSMERIPKIMLLSHASPTNITKHWVNTVTLHADNARVSCSPCHQLHDDITTCRPNKDHTGAACISDISVDMIVETARKLIGK